MKQRVITGFIFFLLIVVFIVPSLWIPGIIIPFSAIVGIISIYELTKALKAGGLNPSRLLIVLGFILSFVLLIIASAFKLSLTSALSLFLLIFIMYLFLCVIIPSIVHKDGIHLNDGLVTAATLLYICFPLFCLCAVTMLLNLGWYYMVPALFASWVSDTCAYFSGVTFGKHKIVPHISPKKTLEGCIGGAIGTALIVTLYFDLVIYSIESINMNIAVFSIIAFILGFVTSVMSQLGDWLASLIKRQVGIKDYGNIFPGHGGMLDRFDSTFFTIPTGLLLALIVVIT